MTGKKKKKGFILLHHLEEKEEKRGGIPRKKGKGRLAKGNLSDPKGKGEKERADQRCSLVKKGRKERRKGKVYGGGKTVRFFFPRISQEKGERKKRKKEKRCSIALPIGVGGKRKGGEKKDS